MNSIVSRSVLCAVALSAILSAPLFAIVGSSIAIDGTTYHEFVFGVASASPGTPATGCGPANAASCSATTNPVAETNTVSPWTFSGAATLFVLDIGDIGDRFDVFDNGTLLGPTSATSGSGNPCGPSGTLDIACALIHNGGPTNLSSGTFQLPAGSHSITLSVIANAPATTFGDAVFLVGPPSISATPAPPTSLLIFAGMLIILGWSWFRRTRAA